MNETFFICVSDILFSAKSAVEQSISDPSEVILVFVEVDRFTAHPKLLFLHATCCSSRNFNTNSVDSDLGTKDRLLLFSMAIESSTELLGKLRPPITLSTSKFAGINGPFPPKFLMCLFPRMNLISSPYCKSFPFVRR